jgi:NAD(P)-dependent dehydrogenase (short-subunit alcohol dehydrogenase family)
MKQKVVVIIGGSSGMGYEIARQTSAGATLRGVDIQNERCGRMNAIERSTLTSAYLQFR